MSLNAGDIINDTEPGSDSEESSTSFHSMTEQLQSLNVEESDFTLPGSMETSKDPPNISTSSTGTCNDIPQLNSSEKDKNAWFDTDENVDVEKVDEEKVDEYFIDEEYLKDLEVNISEEDKQTRHQRAIEKKNEGNTKFKENFYEEAASIYTEGLRECPLYFERDRAILYANRAAARSKLSEDQKKASIKDCDKAICLDSTYLRAIQRRANLHRQLDHLDEALKDYQSVLELDPGNAEARSALMTLPGEIEEKNEKLKTEMMGKLKDLGNMILKPFGLSTANFEMNKSSESGGYTVNFNQGQL